MSEPREVPGHVRIAAQAAAAGLPVTVPPLIPGHPPRVVISQASGEEQAPYVAPEVRALLAGTAPVNALPADLAARTFAALHPGWELTQDGGVFTATRPGHPRCASGRLSELTRQVTAADHPDDRPAWIHITDEDHASRGNEGAAGSAGARASGEAGPDGDGPAVLAGPAADGDVKEAPMWPSEQALLDLLNDDWGQWYQISATDHGWLAVSRDDQHREIGGIDPEQLVIMLRKDQQAHPAADSS